MSPENPGIALVEDEPHDATILMESLAAHGVDADMLWLRNGRTARRLFATQPAPFAAVLLDLELGDDVHGFDVLATIRTNPAMASTPVLVVTAWDMPRNLELASTLGVELFPKPPDVAGYARLAERLRHLGRRP